MKNENIKDTINQVMQYSIGSGCQYACITNGHEWVFFQAFIENKNWQDGNAFIIRSLQDFIDNFSYINNYLTYTKIVDEFSLKILFDGVEHGSGERYESKSQIPAYNDQVRNNKIESELREYFSSYFGAIKNNDEDLLKKCYVEERGYSVQFENVSSFIEDAISPYMKEEVKLQTINMNSPHHNTFSDELKKVNTESKVLVLFGGKGSGKTTFLVNLFNSSKTKHIKKYSIIAYIDLLDIPNDKESIRREIFTSLIKKIDTDKILDGTVDDLCILFEDKYTIELKQTLCGFNETDSYFIQKRNEILQAYKKDEEYCLERLAHYWRAKKKAIIINIDNTDQFDQDLQDYCFSLANNLSKKLKCISIISLREERYISSRIRGYLDAYEDSGFRISSPNPQKVFLKRLEFIKNKINLEKKIDSKNREDINILFRIFIENLKRKNSHFNTFMTAATHGNIREGLGLFKDFVFSAYTNVEEMIVQKKWTIQIHQILKPIMIPRYRFYNESTSKSIPNIYKLRSDGNSSHFTGLRILNKLASRSSEYIFISELEQYFIDRFNMGDDFLLNIDMLLKRSLIESENGIDEYTKDVQKIKITSFGFYMQETIFKDFTYIELISSDLDVFDKSISNMIVAYSNKEYQLIVQGQQTNDDSKGKEIRYKRLDFRKNKVIEFHKYLEKQEKQEVEFYDLEDYSFFTKKIEEKLEEQLEYIEKSSIRSLNIDRANGENKHGITRFKK